MEEENNYIGRTGSESFLVSDDSLKDIDAPFFGWLRDEGFRFGGRKGHFGNCTWVHVSITHKLFAYGMPGVAFGEVTGNHAITIEEFKLIYQIFKNYDGKGVWACKKEHGPIWTYVKPSDKAARQELVDYLEFKGFKCREDGITDRQSTIDSPYPVAVDITGKVYGHLHDNICAAAAASQKLIISAEEFYAKYKGPEIEYREYVAAVREKLKYYLTEVEVDEYLEREDTVELLRKHFDEYIHTNEGGCSPGSTAECLWMMY